MLGDLRLHFGARMHLGGLGCVPRAGAGATWAIAAADASRAAPPIKSFFIECLLEE